MYTVFFMCVLRVLHYIQFFLPFGGFREAWTLACRCSVLLLCSATIPTHACALSFPFFPAFPPLLAPFFLERTFSHPSRLVSSHLNLPLSINQLPRATVPSHNICTFTHTPRRKVTASVVKHVFFCVIIALFVRPVARASFELSGNNSSSPSGRLAPRLCPTLCPQHTPTRFPENFTHTNTYTHSHHIFSTPSRLYPLPSAANVKREQNPLSHRCCMRLGLQR